MTPESRPGPEGPGDPRLGKLLRWYPRAWRERYGEEFLAMVEDTLDGDRPGWRLRLGVVWAGLREHGRRARRAGLAAGHAVAGPQPLMAPAFIVASFPQALKASPPAARAWQATAALGMLTAIVAFAGAAVLASGLVAGPALVRFLRAGGWPEIRRQVAWAAGATMLALYAIWVSELKASVPWLIFGVTVLVMQCAVIAPFRWRRARRSVRRMRAAAARGH